MKLKKRMIFIFFVLSISVVHAQWTEVTNLPEIRQLHCIDAIGEYFAVIGTYPPGVFVTTDAGRSWTVKPIPYSYPVDISAVDETTFYVALGNGNFIKTNDGGDSWTEFYANPGRTYFANYIEMFSPAEGIGMGDAPGNEPLESRIPLFIRMTNGTNWMETCRQPLGGGAANGWQSVDFVDADVGFYSPKGGPVPRWLCRTYDGGINWEETQFGVFANVLKFYDRDYGFLAAVPNLYRTTDGGNSWTDFPLTQSPHDYPARDIEFVPDHPELLWISSYTRLLLSSDSGKTSVEQVIPYAFHSSDIEFGNQRTGWVTGSDGRLIYTNNCGGLISGSADHRPVPEEIELFQNYPNPFNPVTTIRFSVGWKSGGEIVSLKIFDLLGREIKTLVDEFKPPGFYEVTFDGTDLSSGVYFYRINSGNNSLIRSMLLVK